jgi:hypothetical protein
MFAGVVVSSWGRQLGTVYRLPTILFRHWEVIEGTTVGRSASQFS